MCHHYVGAKKHPDLYGDTFSQRADFTQLFLPTYDFWPLAKVPIIRVANDGHRELIAAEWGLLPFWWKPAAQRVKRGGFQRKCVNAKCEDIQTKPSYREAFKRRRCLMPAERFFECGYGFHLPGFEPFAFAGIWESWRDGDDVVESCALLTTEPNDLVRAVGHHRMPVMLTNSEQCALWLNPDITERQNLEPLFLPTDPAKMQSYSAEEGSAVSHQQSLFE
ncbi:MAG TPA: SOS response-associated peptidase [Lacipirellulaceae bacterium]|jgi:putative SOS response-associated peptidase YedK|nr:SOS response-associated peptidase [Lacipirellulaceae bacterium]